MHAQSRSGRNASRGQLRRDSVDIAFSWPNLCPVAQSRSTDCLAFAPIIAESHNSNGSDKNYRFDYQAGVRDTFAQQGTAGLWNAEEGADGRRRRTLDKGVDQ